MAGKWTVQKSELCENTAFILVFLLEEFSRVFGSDVMTNEDCIVYNDARSECPMLITNIRPIHIRLSQETLSALSQTIYQLSHEMCHYAIRQRKSTKDFTLSWFEEIVCEAVSLYILQYSSEQWEKCLLSQTQPYWAHAHKTYLENQLNRESTNEFQECDTVEKLMVYEKQELPESKRETHRAERNAIYSAILANPSELKCVLNYTKYIESNGVTINFDKWIQEDPCDLLQELKKIQPVKGVLNYNESIKTSWTM